MNYAALLAIVATAAVAQLLLKLSVATDTPGPKTWLHLYVGLLSNPYFIVGMAMYGLASIAWMWALKTYPLSKVYPILALTFVFVPLLSRIFLGERIPPTTVVGVLLILAGVTVIGLRA